ncbi:transcription termination/antitermination protein NusG [Qipengyuania citrea]|uniref:transcription termination/antitermination protein NusG n=1 Tax=Qipengyuania citrea TaxID=225971 RepID=UPI0032972D6D
MQVIGREQEDGARWYAVQVKPRREKLAISHLERQGFRTHCPMVGRSKLIAKRPAISREALFPGYVFVHLEADARWRSINGTVGVLRLVTSGNQPSAVPRGFVEKLRESADENGDIAFDDDFNFGDTVRVLGGPFDDLCGSLASTTSAQRVVVLLRMLSGDIRVTLPRAQLVAA